MISSFVLRTFNIRLFSEDQRDKFAASSLSENHQSTQPVSSSMPMMLAEWIGVQSCVNRGYSRGLRTQLCGSQC